MADKLLPVVPRLRFPEFRDAGEWEPRKLGEIANFFKGKGLPKSMLSNYGKSKCIHYGELFTIYPEIIRTVNSRTDLDQNLFLSTEDDVLMPTSDVTPSGLAKACCVKLRDVIIGGDILVVRTDQQRVDGEFLARYIRRLEQRVLQLITGSTVYHLYASSLEKLDLWVPKKPEQQNIADCLGSLDDLIAAQDRKLEALRKHKQGLMQQLFPQPGETVPKLRFPEFGDALHWDKRPLGELAHVIAGQSPDGENCNTTGNGVPFHQGKTDFGDRYLKKPTKWTTQVTKLAEPGDILMSVRAPVGELNISTEQICIGRGLASLRARCDKWFLYYTLLGQQGRIIGNGGSVFDSINKQQIEKLLILTPPIIAEQQKIADCLGSLDDLIAAQGRKLETLKTHKKGLLQQLFPDPEAK